MPDSQEPKSCVMRRYWRRNVMLIGVLVTCWLAVTLIPAYFARELTFDFIGWPFSFWMAAYGAPLCYLVLIGIYARVMNRADDQASRDDERET